MSSKLQTDKTSTTTSVMSCSDSYQLMNKRSRQILSKKLKDVDEREQLVVQKYFKQEVGAKGLSSQPIIEEIELSPEKGQDHPDDEGDDKSGLFIDYYIKQSGNYDYVTNSMGRFERDLLEHVKKIRDGSALLNPQSRSQRPGKPTGRNQILSSANQDKLFAILNDKIKDNFKIDKRSEAEARKLFALISQPQPREGGSSEGQALGKRDLKLFIAFLKEASDNKILANRTFMMLDRLEKAINSSQKLQFDDFVKFICQPNPMKYAISIKGMKGNGIVPGKHLSEADLSQLWTAEDGKNQQKLEETQHQNRQKLSSLKIKLKEVIS